MNKNLCEIFLTKFIRYIMHYALNNVLSNNILIFSNQKVIHQFSLSHITHAIQFLKITHRLTLYLINIIIINY